MDVVLLAEALLLLAIHFGDDNIFSGWQVIVVVIRDIIPVLVHMLAVHAPGREIVHYNAFRGRREEIVEWLVCQMNRVTADPPIGSLPAQKQI